MTRSSRCVGVTGLALLLLLVVRESSPVQVAASSSRSEHAAEKPEPRTKIFNNFLKFETNSKDKLQIKLDFSVPFITVPLRSNDPSKPSAPVELNVRGLLLAAGLGAVAAVLVPALTSSPGPFEMPAWKDLAVPSTP